MYQSKGFKTKQSSINDVLPLPVNPPTKKYIDFLIPIYLLSLLKPIGIPEFFLPFLLLQLLLMYQNPFYNLNAYNIQRKCTIKGMIKKNE
jgi:hypothetical protein